MEAVVLVLLALATTVIVSVLAAMVGNGNNYICILIPQLDWI